DKLQKQYPNGFKAVAALDLTIEDGEFIVLVGPSGCGKSTTLRMIAGLETITGGELRIDGRRVNEVPPKGRDVAMVFQSYALYPHMTVFENMAFGLRLKKIPEAEIQARVEEAAERLGITSLLARKPKEMSGGQRQRVAMGRAIVRHPKIFLFDEPLSNLDAKLRLQMRVEVGRLHRALGATSVYVTHDQVEAMTLADRIVLLKDGDVQQIGAPMDLYQRPNNLFVATFIGSPVMNVIPVQYEDGYLRGEGLKLPYKGEVIREEMRLGIRPQSLKLVDEGAPHALAARVEVVEPMGSETFVYCRYGDELLGVRVEGLARPEIGGLARLAFDLEAIHLFDAASGARI
ncbi:sn-glycerol-3-phosphate ABC transporter ATP-binding protein UgpC, partial [Myxococcota bacterium]|nr:sn-glycerol-3-phosphate ABC transporter ATP-binding protein UgpC [Myxococcota bacterium]